MNKALEKDVFRPWLISLVNFFLSFSIMGSIIFIPLLGSQLGASDFQVGLVGAVYGSTFLISSLYSGWKSDKLGRLFFVRWGLLVSSLAFAAQLLANSVMLLVVVRGVVGLALGTTVAASVAYAYEAGSNMGKFSSYGSLGWIFGALAAALASDIYLLFWLSFLVCLAAFFISLVFRELPGNTATLPVKMWHVMWRNYRLYLAVFLRHVGAHAVWIILPLHLVSLGMNKSEIGLLWGINFSVQFIVMRFMDRFSEYKVFAFGQLLSIIVFVAYAFVTGWLLLVTVQVMLGVAWSCLYVGALLIVLRSGEERGTAGGIFQSTLHLCSAVGPLAGGLIAEALGYQGVMLFAAALGLAGMLIAVPGEKQVSPRAEV